MDKSLLVKLFGFPATLIHGDTLILDRWRWLKGRLPPTRNGERVLDVGCGSGAFSIGAALLGYHTLGLSWDERNQNVAHERAKICGAQTAAFELQDVRFLDERTDLNGYFDIIINCENIEHIIDDRKLMCDQPDKLKPGGRLLLSTPYLLYQPISTPDYGPFLPVENGGHVRRGYTSAMLIELCQLANLVPERITYCSGFFSQKITGLLRRLSKLHPLLGWSVVLPLRVLPLLLDTVVGKLTSYPYYSICIEAYKPRYDSVNKSRFP